MIPVQTADARDHADAVKATLGANQIDTYDDKVFEAIGPPSPAAAVPYQVIYFDVGTPGGYPMNPGRDFDMVVSVRGIGRSAEQAQRAAISARNALLGNEVVVAGRRVRVTQDPASSPYPEVDDSITPPLFQQLVVLNLHSD